MRVKRRRTVWVGFVEGDPHVYECEIDGTCLAVFPSREAARPKYQDVREAELVWWELTKRKVRK